MIRFSSWIDNDKQVVKSSGKKNLLAKKTGTAWSICFGF